MKVNDQAGTATNRLRYATRDQHAALESQLDWDSAFASLENYAALLRRILSVQAPADAVIDSYLSDGPGWLSSRRTAGWIRTDLSRVELKRSAIAEQAAMPADLDWVDSGAAAAGLLYVLEGSTMGAGALARMGKSRLGVTPGDGCDYFSAYGGETVARWRETKRWLDAWLTTPAQQDAAEQAAQRAFHTYASALSGG